MITLLALLAAAGFLISWPATRLMRSLGHRAGALDGQGVPGQIKAPPRRVPNTGGIAIVLGITLPILFGLLALHSPLADRLASALPGAGDASLSPHLPGLRATTADAAVMLLAIVLLHVMGVIDDRRPLGPALKLAVILALALGTCWWTDSRLLTLLDGPLGGRWASLAAAVLWIAVVTNAMNFLDNMDGLSGGVGAIASACFLVAALAHPSPQWFIAAALALLIGSLLGFLVYNFPWSEGRSASIFMGDGGSLVVGFLLGFLTVRTTYYAPVPLPAGEAALTGPAGGWYAVFMPLVILAVPLYDFVSVCAIRIAQGRSPFVGDLQHFSHRLVQRGLSRRDAVLVICALTAVTAISGTWLGSLAPWQAALVAVQTLLVLAVIAALEHHTRAATRSAPPPT